MVYLLSDHGLELIKRWEGFREKAYFDVAGIPTIGYGHTKDVHMGQSCTVQQADRWLREDALEAEKAVNRLVTVPISQSEFNSLVSFAFNLGAGALGGSTLLKMLNAGDKMGAAMEFQRWSKAKVGGELKPVTGLLLRRFDEARVFLGA